MPETSSGLKIGFEAMPGPGAWQALASIILINVLVAIISLVHGFDYAFPGSLKASVYRCAALVLLGLAMGALVLARSGSGEPAGPQANAYALGLLCLFQLSLTIFFNLPTKLASAVIIAVWVAGWGLARAFGAIAVVVSALMTGFAIYICSILFVPLWADGADMLPFISHAIDIFRGGGNPYTADYSSIDENPFFYAPLQWLIYLPFQGLGIDLRVLNILSAAAMVMLVEQRARASVDGSSPRVAIYPLLLSPLVLPMMYAGQVWPYWLSIQVFAFLVLDRRWVWAAVAAGVAVGTRQTALIPVASIMVALLGRLRLLDWLRAGAAATVTVAMIFLPFATSVGALDALFVSGPARALAQAHMQGNPSNQISTSNILDWLGLGIWDSRIELVLAVLTMAGTWYAFRQGVAPMLTIAGIGYVLTISANPYLHRYYYFAGLMLASIGIAAGTGKNTANLAPSDIDEAARKIA